MEKSEVEIRPKLDGIEAEQRWDCVSGDGGYFISVVGWGGTEEAARANLAKALERCAVDAKTPER